MHHCQTSCYLSKLLHSGFGLPDAMDRDLCFSLPLLIEFRSAKKSHDFFLTTRLRENEINKWLTKMSPRPTAERSPSAAVNFPFLKTRFYPSFAETAPARISGPPASASSMPQWKRPTAASEKQPGSRCSLGKQLFRSSTTGCRMTPLRL